MTQHTTAQNLSPNRSLQEIFEDVKKTAEHCISQIEELARDVHATLGENLSEEHRHNLEAGLSSLRETFDFLECQAARPELVLATTGTTSSGKSTLANFLIGEAILPSGVQEMSAGLVEVRHGERRSLTIPKTKGAKWETGRWENLTADEVSRQLEETMMAFREEENRNREIEPVLFEIEWPIRLAERKEALGLPEGTQVTILDLPGLKAVNDERNGPIIRRNIAKAFCLIAYNAEETDKEKQKTLLNQVVNQVMALSYGEKGEEKDKNAEKQKETHRKGSASSLSRMFFLLNRVDAFYRDKDPKIRLDKFRGDVTSQIQEKLKRALPEDKEDIEKIALSQICSFPALLAVDADRLWEEPEKQAALLEELEGSFKKIFPENYFKQFPRDLKDLEKNQRKDLIKKALDCSFANDFETYLSQYIHTKLPQIIVGGPLNQINQQITNVLMTLDLILESHTTRTQEEAERKKALLSDAEKALQAIAQDIIDACKPLTEINSFFSDSEQSSEALASLDNKIDERFNEFLKHFRLDLDTLAPLRDVVNNVLSKPLTALENYVLPLMPEDEEDEDEEDEEGTL